MLRIAIPYGTLSSDQMRMLAHVARRYDRGYGHFTTRQNIQFNWIKLAELPDAMADLARADLHAHADQRQLRAQHHHRSVGRASPPTRSRIRASGPRSCASTRRCIRNSRSCRASSRSRSPPPTHDRAAVQGARHRPAAASQRRGRDRLRGDRRRRARPHAVHRQDDQAVPAQARSPELRRGDPARLQSVRPARQHLQGAHQDSGARTRRRGLRQGGRGGMAVDQGRRARARSGGDRRRRRALPLSRLREARRRSARARAHARAGDRALRRLARQFGRQSQGAGLRHRHALAQAGGRAAGRRHRRADGRDRRSRRPLLVRRDPRRPRAESGAAACRAARSAGAVARARRDRRRDAECRARLRHHRLPGARLLQPRQYALDPGRAGADAALPRSRSRARSRPAAHQHFRLHQRLRPSPRRPYRHSRRREERRGVLPDHARRPRRRAARSSARCSVRRCPTRRSPT